MIRGINLAGAEFGEKVVPGVFGTHYTFNSPRSFAYFAARGLRAFRIPLLWERLQPDSRGPLDPVYLARLRENARWAQAVGGVIIPELHNFGYYQDRPATGAELVSVWEQLSDEFAGDDGVLAYDLMNEPRDVPHWEWNSQQAVAAIRARGDRKFILVPGDNWSSANRWPITHPRPWIDDPADNFAYEAHLYFDSNESGRYGLSYDEEQSLNPDIHQVGRYRLAQFAGWCATFGVRGIVGEYGVPAAEPRWHAVLDDLLEALDELGMDGLYWAAGEWWPAADKLSVQPEQDFTLDRPQLAILQRHPSTAVQP